MDLFYCLNIFKSSWINLVIHQTGLLNVGLNALSNEQKDYLSCLTITVDRQAWYFCFKVAMKLNGT